MDAFPRTPWIDDTRHQAWLDAGLRGLIRFAQPSILPDGGFTYQGADGGALDDRPPALFLTARMVHAASIGAVRGIPGSQRLLDHAIDSLDGLFADTEHGGWFTDPAEPDGRKMTYDHVHIAMAASSAVAAGHPKAPALLERAITIIDTHLFDEEAGALRETFARDWSDSEAYRGANANMHGVEAFIAVGDVTGDPRWHERALGMADRIINQGARAHDWLIPEHFDTQWNEDLEYNRDEPDHPFRPYGATYGHSLEWARFLVNLYNSPALPHTPWLLEAAEGLTRTALERGWRVDGKEGLPYTVDWFGKPVSTLRLHWPICEGIQACASLSRQTGAQEWDDWYRVLWDHAQARFIDDSGTWINELDADLHESGTVWPGRPDYYHCIGAYVVPSVPLTPCLTLAAAGLPSRLTPPA